MTTSTLSPARSTIAARLALTPFTFVGIIAAAVAGASKEAFAELREDFAPAVRYVVFGHPNRTLAIAASERAASVRDTAIDFYDAQVRERLFALFVLLISPILIAVVAYQILADDDFFGGIADGYRSLGASLVTGQPVY